MTVGIMILCQDTYGRGFFKDLTNRMKNESRIPILHVLVDRFYGPCNSKMERQMRAMAHQRNCQFFIVVADADGHPEDQVEEDIRCHVPEEFRDSARIVILRYEIEDWICISRGICINEKSSIILRHREGYEKYRLRDYVQELDFERLLKECESFCAFVECFCTCA